MKKIEEKYIKTEYKVVAYDVYVDNVCKGKKGACSSAYLVLKDGNVVGKSSYFADSISKVRAQSIAITRSIRELCKGANLITVHLPENAAYYDNLETNEEITNETKSGDVVLAFRRLTENVEVIFEVAKWYTADKYNTQVEEMAKAEYEKNFRDPGDKPTYQEFCDYCKKTGWTEEGFDYALWNFLEGKKWLTKKGTKPKTWQSLANAYNPTIRKNDDRFMSVDELKNKKRKEAMRDEVENKKYTGHYICYTDGSCDNYSTHRAGGSAYIVINAETGEIEKVKSYHTLGTTSNRMEMLAIISAVNYCPKGSHIVVVSDSKYAIKMFKFTNWEIGDNIKNPDLIKMYRKCAEGKDIRLEWIKGHGKDNMNVQADCLAFRAYERALEENNLPMAPEKYRAQRRGKLTLEETA